MLGKNCSGKSGPRPAVARDAQSGPQQRPLGEEGRFDFEFILRPGFSVTALAFAVEALAEANAVLGWRDFTWVVRAERNEVTKTALGFKLVIEPLSRGRRRPKALFLVGDTTVPARASSTLLGKIRDHYRHGALVGASGAEALRRRSGDRGARPSSR